MTDTMQCKSQPLPVQSVLPLFFVQLVIGELVIIFFIGHWNLIIGYFCFPGFRRVGMSVAADLFWTCVGDGEW